MPVNHKFKLIFIHIPKTGGSSIERFVKTSSETKWELKGKILSDFRSEHRIQDHRFIGDGKPANVKQHLSAMTVKSILGEEVWSKYASFTVVRNPWDLIVSIYEYNKQTGGRKQTEGKSFEEWFYSFRPICDQYSFITDDTGKVLVDTVLQFEELEEAFKEFFKREVNPNITVELSHEKKTVRKNYREYYTEEMAEIVKNMNERFIKEFDYSF